MIEAARLGVYVSAEGVDQTRKQIGGLGDTLGSVAGKAMMAGGVMTAAVTGPLLMMGNKAVDAASDVMESMNKVNVVFGTSAGAVEQFANTAATNLGMSKGEALEAAGTFGNLFTTMGLGKDVTANMSTQLLTLAADLGSFNNVDPTVVLEKLRSGLTGEAEPLKALGILINDTTVKAKAASMGLLQFEVDQTKVTAATIRLKEAQEKATEAIKKYGPSSDEAAKALVKVSMAESALAKAQQGKEIGLTESVKVQARYALMLEQSANAQGDFIETSGGMANATRIQEKMMQDLAATIGQQLLPVKMQLIQIVQQVITWFQNLNPSTQGLVVIFGALAAAAGPLLMILGTLATAIGAIGLPVVAVVAALGALSAAWATNFGGIRDVTMPFIEEMQAWFGEAIPAAIAKFQDVWAKLVEFFGPTVERIRAAVGPMVESFSPLGDKIAAVWAIVEPVLSALANIIGTVVVVAFNLLLEVVAAVMPSIGTIIGNAIDIAVTVLQTLSTVVTEVVGLVTDLINGDFTGAWEHVQTILDTLKEAVVTIFGEIADTVLIVIKDLITAFTNWYNSLSKNSEFVRNTLTPALQSLANLLSGAVKTAVETVTGVFNGLKGAIDSIGGAVNSMIGWLDNLKNKLGSLKLPAWLTQGSPTPFEYGLLGINEALLAVSAQGLPEMAEAMSTLGNAVDSVLGIFSGIQNITVIGDITGRMRTFKDQVVAIIRELADLAGMLAGMPEGANWASAKAGLDAVVGVFEPLLKSLETITGVGDMKILTDIPERIAFIKAAFLALIRGVAEMTNSPEMAGLTAATATGLGLSAFGKAIEGVFGPLREAAKAWETIKSFDFSTMKVEPVLRWLASFGAMAVQAVEWARSWAGTAGEGMGAFIAGVGTAVKSLADVAKAWEVIQQFNWSALDAKAVVDWLAALGGLAVKAMNWASTWAAPGAVLDVFAQAVKTSLGGLVEVAKAWEVLATFKWNAGLDMKKVVDWLAALGGLAVTALENVAAWKQFETIDAKVKDLAAYMQSAFGAMSAAVQFTNELDGWKDLPDLEGKFDRLRRAIEYIVPQFELTRKAVGELAYEEVRKFSQALQDIAAGIQAALNLLQTDISNLSIPDATFWDPLNDWIKSIFTSFASFLADNPYLTDESLAVKPFAEALSALMQGLQAALELALAVPQQWSAPDPTTWNGFENWVKSVFSSFADYVKTKFTGPNAKAELELVGTFAAAMSSLMSALEVALKLALAVPLQWTLPDPATWKGFEDWVKGVFTSFADYVKAKFSGPDAKAQLEMVGIFAAAMSQLMQALQVALQLAIAVPTTWAPPSLTIWKAFEDWVKAVFLSFSTWVAANYPTDSVAAKNLPVVKTFAEAMSALFQGLVSAFGVFSGLIGFVSPSEAQFAAFEAAVKKVFTDFAAYAKTELVISANAAVKAFGDAMGSLFSGLNTALTFTSAVYKEAPGFFAFLASAGTTGGDFQVKMGLIFTSITETMTRFKANVIDKVKTDWLPSANALLSAVQSVFGVLNQALGIFKDLNTVGMPDSKTITGFIDAVVSLFTKLTQQLGLVPGQVGTSISAARLVITDPSTLQRYSESGSSLATSMVGGLKWGMSNDWAKSTLDTGVGVMVTAIATSFKGKMGIASPSTVFMGYGQQLAAGLSIGLNKGLDAMGLPMNGQMQLAYAGLPTQTVRVQVGGDISIGGQRVTPEMADEIAYLLTQRLRLRA